MKIPQTKKILTTLLFSIIANVAYAWSGYDYDNKTEIDIGQGNLVREGLMIQFYDNKADDFKTAKVLLMEEIAGGTRIQVQDLDSKKERTFIMGE
jgi:hypothetical protein